MAQNKSRLGTGVFLWEGNEIKLQASLDRLKSLTEATGEDGLDYMGSVDSPLRLTTLFYHLQIGSAYSEEDIYSFFFGNFGDFAKPEFQEALMTCLGHMTGQDLAEAIKPATATQKK